MMLVVKLDKSEYCGGDPGTVVAIVESVAEYHAMITDRDGAFDRHFRLWEGTAKIGERVRAKELP